MATEFNQEFIERRMAEHKRWQHDAERQMIAEIIDEVQELPRRNPRASGSGYLFEKFGGIARPRPVC